VPRSGRRASETSAHSGSAPIAARSLRLTASAFQPRSRQEVKPRSKCTPSTSRSVVATSTAAGCSQAAASSPMPISGTAPPPTPTIARRRSISPNSPTWVRRCTGRSMLVSATKGTIRGPMPYRVLAIAPTPFFADYGCHVRIYEEARALGRLGHEVVICTYHNGRNPPPAPGVRVRRMPRVPWHAEVRVGSTYHKLYFDALLAATALVASLGRIDVVHAHLHEGALIGALVSRLRRVPLVFDYQGSRTREMLDHQFLREESPLYRPLQRLEHLIERLPDLIITSSQHAAHQLCGWQGVRVECLPDAVDTHVFRPPPVEQVQALRRRLGIPPEREVVGFLGLLAEYQGVGHLLYAARRVIERRPGTHFLIMGYPGLERYQRQAYDLQILDHVTFTGRVPYAEAPLHLALADVAVSPKRSASEANGKLLNYMAMGLPTI